MTIVSKYSSEKINLRKLLGIGLCILIDRIQIKNNDELVVRGLFQLGARKQLLKSKFKQESVTFMPPNKEVKINNIKPFPVNWT